MQLKYQLQHCTTLFTIEYVYVFDQSLFPRFTDSRNLPFSTTEPQSIS